MTLALPTRLFILAAALVIVVLAARFGRGQNRQGKRGGAIPPPKVAWLAYAVLLWFFVAPAVALDPAVHPALRALLGGFAVLMWARGLAELLMLYRFHNWRPPYGIAHDLLCLLLLIAGLVWTRPAASEFSALDHHVLGLLALLIASLVVEVLYAALFFRAVHGHTTGADGVWFADQDQPRFRRINAITAALNVPFYLGLLTFVVATWS